MEGEAVAAVLQVLVQNLVDHSKSEISLIRGFRSEAAKLNENLDTIQKYLNGAQNRSISDEVRSWLMKLENLAFDADNVLDELSYHHISNKIKAIKPLKEKVLSCLSSFNYIARMRTMALKIKEINENLESINKVARDLGLVQRLTDAPPLLDASFETDSFTLDPIFIGRDNVLLEIVERLTTGIISTDEREISTLAIVGMGGLGKTTLIRKVFNHQRMKTRFGSLIWVHVSQIFDPFILFKKILKELTSDQVEVESKQDILKRLQKALKDKTFLLVLDDVWNEDHLKWEDFKNSLLGVTSSKGNAIVVTTRNMNVASSVNPFHKHELRGLSQEDCWSIIKAKTFGKEDVPSEFESIGRKIARRCQGLPLAANVVGGVLRDKSEEKWLSIEQKWLSHDEANNITKILRLSFDNLSPPLLKKCFAYCSMFSKGLEIKKQELIEYWMAEGFVQAEGSNDIESMGEKFMNVLLHNSLLQVTKRDDFGNVKSCAMHDLVHDMACSVLGSCNNSEGMRLVRYTKDQSNHIPKEVAKYLRTLFLEGEISATMFSDFESLHVLTLEGYEVELPSSIRKLIHLRKLDISRTGIEELPQWIGELHHLQTLRAKTGHLYVSKVLPSTLKYLINLRHLYIDNKVQLPVGIGRLTSLQTLKHFRVGDKNGCRVEELGSLNNLKGKLKIYNLERVPNKEEAEKASLFKKSKIFYLCLEWEENRKGETNDENVLEGLQPHSDLKKLVIKGFNGKRFPLWSLKMAVRDGPQGSGVGLNKLISLSLLYCKECEEIPMLGHLPNLKSLQLGGWSNLESINSSFYGSVKEETLVVFPALERLELIEMPKLAEWAEAEYSSASEVKVFPQLRHLEIRGCQQLTSAPRHLSFCLEHFEIRRIGSYKPLADILETKLTLLKELHLEEIDGLECLPDWLFYSNPNLSKLEIMNCPNLRELPNGLCSLNSLEELTIWECPNLQRIEDSGVEQSQGSSSLTSLRTLRVGECDGLVYLPCAMVGSSLQVLWLRKLSSLENLPALIDCLPKSPHLMGLRIEGVPKFMATGVDCWSFRSLQFLTVDVSMGGSMETVDGILQGCSRHSLQQLSLKGMESWECVPESIQHLTALDELQLENFGMEELPEWLGNLSSLYELDLVDCKKLRRLPSTDAMRRLTRLSTLEMKGCPKLLMKKTDADSEWSKISHIHDITIDGSNPKAGKFEPAATGFKYMMMEKKDRTTLADLFMDQKERAKQRTTLVDLFMDQEERTTLADLFMDQKERTTGVAKQRRIEAAAL